MKSPIVADGIEAGQRVGIFGGTFNPVHMGHINAVTTVQSRLGLDKIVFVPASQSPLKDTGADDVSAPSVAANDKATDEQRLEMLRLATKDLPWAAIDDQEIKRGGVSYTIDTVSSYSEVLGSENVYLIIGLDQFSQFDSWKDFSKLLEISNLVVVTRPKHTIPFSIDDVPQGIRGLVGDFDRQFMALSTGRSIEFIRLQDLDIASSHVRKRLRSGLNVDRHLSIPVEEYIRKNALYAPLGPRIEDYESFTRFCARALYEKKAINVRGFDLRPTTAPTEFTLIASGTSTRHAAALAESVQKAVKEEYGVLPQSLEGAGEGRWVVLDFGALIVHVFYDFVRQEYRLEDLWREGRDLQLKDETPAPSR